MQSKAGRRLKLLLMTRSQLQDIKRLLSLYVNVSFLWEIGGIKIQGELRNTLRRKGTIEQA